MSSQSLHSVRGTSSKLQFSSSTSALQSAATTATRSGHTRRRAVEGLQQPARNGVNDMPPPNYVPVRPGQQESALEKVICTPNNNDRPSHVTVIPTAASRPMPIHEASSRPKTGPIRPTPETVPGASTNANTGKSRVVGGARRVLLVPEAMSTGSSTKAIAADSRDPTSAYRAHASAITKPVDPRKPIGTNRDVRVRRDINAHKERKPAWGRSAPLKPVDDSKFEKVGKRRCAPKSTAAVPPARVLKSQKEALPEETPLPPSPIDTAASIPLPPSPKVPLDKVEDIVTPATPTRSIASNHRPAVCEQTPISALVADIEREFLFTPYSPISPAQPYLPHPPVLPLFQPLRALSGTIAYKQIHDNSPCYGPTVDPPSYQNCEGDMKPLVAEVDNHRMALDELQVNS